MEEEDWAKMLKGCQEMTHPRDSVLMSDDHQSEHIYRILSGTVRVEKWKSTDTDHSHAPVLLRLNVGETFGEMSFLDNDLPVATCVADSAEVKLALLPKTHALEQMQTDGQLKSRFYHQLAKNVTHRLALLSVSAADIGQAPVGKDNEAQPVKAQASSLSARKLQKTRKKFNVPDDEHMLAYYNAGIVNTKKLLVHGQLFVFDMHVCFATKVFGMSQVEVIHMEDITEVLRQSQNITFEDFALEIGTRSDLTYIFKEVQNVDEAFDTIQAARRDMAKPGYSPSNSRASVAIKSAFQANPHEAPTPASKMGFDRKLMEGAIHLTFKLGDVIVEEGVRPDALWQVAKGKVSVEKKRQGEDGEESGNVKILTLFEKAFFCEMGFLTNEETCAAIVADSPVVEVYKLSRDFVANELSKVDQEVVADFYHHLATYLTQRVRHLTHLVGESLAAPTKMAITLDEVLGNEVFFSLFKKHFMTHHQSDMYLLLFLQDVQEFMSVPDGQFMKTKAHKIFSKYMRVGGPFAESRDKCEAELEKEGLPSRDIFVQEYEKVFDMVERDAYKHFAASPAFQSLLDLKAKEQQVPKVQDFKMLAILGEGYEGKVLMVRKKDSGVHYALKVLDKVILAQRSRRWQLHCSREREVLMACNHAYVVKMSYSFQSSQYLYFVLEFVCNATLQHYLEMRDGRGVPEKELRFMIGQLSLGLHHMHAQQLLYRDLKPANVLLDDEGHLRLVDMGMATRLDPETGKRKSVCGTQRYMAPEMRNKEPYNESVDWYSLGKLVLDCQGRGTHQHTSDYWHSSGLMSLVEGLLKKNPRDRLGTNADGFQGIKDHTFFKVSDFAWDLLELKRLPSPLQPDYYVVQHDASKHFRSGDDINSVCDKLQHLSGHGDMEEQNPGMVPNWDYVNPGAIYIEYLQSPYHNSRTF